MSLETITYALKINGRTTGFVRGYQVGFFAVRACVPGELAFHEETGRIARAVGFSVDHWPSGSIVSFFDTEGLAWKIADDLSIAYGGTEEAREPVTTRALIAHMNPELLRWINSTTGDRAMRLREWREQQRAKGAA